MRITAHIDNIPGLMHTVNFDEASGLLKGALKGLRKLGRAFEILAARGQHAADYEHFKELGCPNGLGEGQSAHRSVP